MIGGMLVKLAFVTCLVSVLSYFQHHRQGKAGALKFGRIFFLATVVLVLSTAAVLLSLILTHQFQYSYVWSYSSTSLSTPLLISTFYAGQEGSFMLWTMYTSLIGVILMYYSSKKGYETQVMAVFGLVELMLLLMLIVKDPFMYVWETWPADIKAGFSPVNGRGLNPLLQNYWMVIHPQVLFSGFAAMSVPYVYAVAAMMKRDYTNWIRPATPWLVYGALVLGTGIMMGGFWAYETLGWGGYWGWDPVENSSLVPWLVGVASIHTILSQRKSGAFVRTNLVLSMLCFVFVLYSTFLTRSGVLGDTSVHSFVDPGMWAYWLLIAMMTLFTVLGFGLLAVRLKELPKVPVRHHYWSREFALLLASVTLVCIAVLVTIGTSSPLITGILEGKKTAVDTSYYSSTIPPLGIVVGLLAGIGQLLWWTRSSREELLKSLRVPVFLAALTTLALVLMGIHGVIVVLLVFAAAFALFANIQVGIKIFKGNPKYAGGSVAHVGLAIMLLGFIASSKYDNKQTLSLVEGQPTEALGYRLTYAGYAPLDNEKYAFHVHIEKDGRRSTVSPVMYYSEYSKGLMRNPDILNLITKDFYLAPMSLEQNSDADKANQERVQLRKGESKKIGDLRVTFVDFDFPVMEKAAMLEGRDVRIGAKLIVSEYGKKPVTITPAKLMSKGETTDQPARYAGRFEFTILGMHPDREAKENSTVEVGVQNLQAKAAQGTDQRDILVVEASVKPYINLVWAGVIIVLVGFLVTIIRRVQEAAMKTTVEGA